MTDNFHKELTSLINRYSKENNSGTPDFILANYIDGSLKVYEETVRQRENWFGRAVNPDFDAAPVSTRTDER